MRVRTYIAIQPAVRTCTNLRPPPSTSTMQQALRYCAECLARKPHCPSVHACARRVGWPERLGWPGAFGDPPRPPIAAAAGAAAATATILRAKMALAASQPHHKGGAPRLSEILIDGLVSALSKRRRTSTIRLNLTVGDQKNSQTPVAYHAIVTPNTRGPPSRTISIPIPYPYGSLLS